MSRIPSLGPEASRVGRPRLLGSFALGPGTRWLLALLFQALALRGLSAFNLEPISTSVAPSGPESIATFRLKSEDQGRIAIRFRVMRRDLAPDGKELDSPADEDFLVYPSRMILEPGAQAAVKVQWKGPAKLETEASYRFIAEQLPIDAGKPESSGIRVMFRYLAALYVREASFAPELRTTVLGARGPAGEEGFLVTIENRGSRHVVALSPSLVLDGGRFRLSAEQLGKLAGANYLAGRSIRLFVPGAGAVEGHVYDASLDYEGVF